MDNALSRRRFLQGATSLAVVGGAAGWLSSCSDGDSTAGATLAGAGGEPKRGGRLRVGMSTGGSTDTLDPHLAVSTIDAARAGNLFDRLTILGAGNKLVNELAESFEPNSDATVWTVRLRKGVTWHDGKPLTADDVKYTLMRIGDPDSVAPGKAKVAAIDLAGLKKADDLTLVIPLLTPIADLPTSFSIFYMGIIQDGSTDEALRSNPVGTGPYVYKSLDPGKNSLFTRNPEYWQSGRPYADELVLESITDPAARLNALLGGQVDMVEALEFPQAAAEKGGSRIIVAETNPGQIVPMTMRADTKPFDDVRVRQAFRLIADREALIATAQLGLGDINNDLFGQGLPYYNDTLPQRAQDIDQAKSLLKAAGAEDLVVELATSKVAPGMLESATAFAEQAKLAGVSVNLNRIPDSDFYGANYLKYVFGMTQWTSQPITSWLDDAVVSGAAYNETGWFRPDFDKLVADARSDLDEGRRTEKYQEVQRILHDEGGYLIWGSQPFLDGLATNVGGFTPISAQALGNYNFRDYWLS